MSTQNERELLVSVNEVRSLVIPKSTEDWAVKKAFEQFKHLKSLNMGEWDAFEDAMITLRNEFMKSRNPVLPSLTDIVISQLSEDQSRIDALSKDAEWQPIETAPKTGRTILIGYFNKLGNWRTMRGEWFSREYIDEYFEDPDMVEPGWYEVTVEADESPNCWPTNPTHWKPLPKPPAIDTAISAREGE